MTKLVEETGGIGGYLVAILGTATVAAVELWRPGALQAKTIGTAANAIAGAGWELTIVARIAVQGFSSWANQNISGTHVRRARIGIMTKLVGEAGDIGGYLVAVLGTAAFFAVDSWNPGALLAKTIGTAANAIAGAGWELAVVLRIAVQGFSSWALQNIGGTDNTQGSTPTSTASRCIRRARPGKGWNRGIHCHLLRRRRDRTLIGRHLGREPDNSRHRCQIRHP